ncbi:MAG: putative phosphatase [Clostridia bacterium]|nr:putative phosphatase [Clostridia bacterium]
MFKFLQPDLYVESLLAIPYERLWQQGIRGFIVDLDNTVTEWNLETLRPEVKEWFNRVREKGFKTCLVSNNRENRVASVAEILDIPCISRAGKPRRRAFRQAMGVMGTRREETAVVGDQLFTDILGGNRLGLYTVLVVPLTRREFIGTQLVRKIERLVLRTLSLDRPQH